MKFLEKVASVLFFIAAAMIVAVVGAMCIFLLKEGIPAISEIGMKDFILGKSWRPSENKYGLLPMILGSAFITFLAAAAAIPFSVFTAVFTAKFCPDWMYGIIKTIIVILAAIPSVVYGLFGLTAVAPVVKKLFGGDGASMLAAAAVLAIMIFPTITAGTEAALSSASKELYCGALALGADKERSIYFVLLPSIKNAIFSSILLYKWAVAGSVTAHDVFIVARGAPR